MASGPVAAYSIIPHGGILSDLPAPVDLVIIPSHMTKRRFISLAGGTIVSAGAGAYLLSDKRNFTRSDVPESDSESTALMPDESEILFLASLAPSGHNTQPWFVQYLEPYHWVIGNDRSKWLPAVDPTQRETILSIGAFLQNLEYAADSFGFDCQWTLLATTLQDEQVIGVKLVKRASQRPFDLSKIKSRRTVRAGYSRDPLKAADLASLIGAEKETIHYLPATGREARFINEQTIEANRLQSYREPAQQELAEWIRFSSKDARQHRDGLTTGGMEIEGLPGWWARNFYGKASVLKKGFRELGITKVREEVSASAGWILISSNDSSVAALLDTGRRMQRLFLKVRERNIAIHPMTQILEEATTRESLPRGIGMGSPVQFILRAGYLATYPPPVSLRRPVSRFVRLAT